MSKKTDPFVWFAAAILATVAVIVLAGAYAIEKRKVACAERGGVQVKAYGGFMCIKANEIQEAEK